jgi:hypothetical protein
MLDQNLRDRPPGGGPQHGTAWVACKEPFAPTDGEYVLKYFLVDKAKKHNGIDLRMNHPAERRASKSRLAPTASLQRK